MSAVTVVLVWKFSPPDYFGEPITISRSDYTMAIDNGQVEASIASAVYDANPNMLDVLHQGLNDRFLGAQLLTHSPYELSKPTMTRVHPDGRKDTLMELEAGHYTLSGDTVDFQHVDKNGNVVSDSARDRIEKKKRLADLVTKYSASDQLLGSLLKSYNASVRDPNNELVHLYEIRDGLSAKFGGENAARSTLAVSSAVWSRLGLLCNNEPLRQGRHRGKTASSLRDATEAELAEARAIARGMIEAYLEHLQSSSGAGAP